jgi:hypothetical protein
MEEQDITKRIETRRGWFQEINNLSNTDLRTWRMSSTGLCTPEMDLDCPSATKASMYASMEGTPMRPW